MTDTPRTEAGRRLLARESYNSRSFALITVEDILAIEAEAAAGPRDVPVLPPPDLSLIDTLGEGADPDRPVRVKASE